MRAKLKLGGYGLLLVLAICFAWGFYCDHTTVTAGAGGAPMVKKGKKNKAHMVSASTNQTPTNAVAPMANDLSSNAVVEANPSSAAAGEPATNEASPSTVAAAGEGSESGARVPTAEEEAELRKAQSSMIRNLGGMILAIIGLGIMIAYDFTQYFANRSIDMLFDDDGTAGKDPEYERAEQVWADGHPMEAIQIMRDYLAKNPREQYVALRIAEIYEKDFKNYLAAALEYEEVLKHKLQPDRWGWTAIHLCNLYTKLGRQSDCVALLERIVNEYPKTSAAIKARKNLNLPEESAEAADTPEPAAEAPSEAAPAKSNLPPGFRPKQ